jgi:hypothetical protein
MRPVHLLGRLGLALLAGGAIAASASASATPIGALPRGKTTTVTVVRGGLVAVALPRASAKSGLVWRIARPFDPHVVREIAEGELGTSVVIVFKGVAKGHASIVVAQTLGDTGTKAFKAVTYDVTVT